MIWYWIINSYQDEVVLHRMVWHDTSQLNIAPNITTTLAESGQLLAGNRFAEGKATKLPSARAGRDEEASRSLSFEPSL